MGKASKARRKDYRRQQKRLRKAAQKAKYAEWTKSGNNSKRSKLRKSRKRMVRTKRHAIAYCGNVGCKRCHPETAIKPGQRWLHPQ